MPCPDVLQSGQLRIHHEHVLCPVCQQSYPLHTIHCCPTITLTMPDYPGFALHVPNGTPIDQVRWFCRHMLEVRILV